MTKLLVSVRDASEAQIAFRGGADLIDIKEPTRGSLGSADTQVIEEIVARLKGQVPLSVALGELLSASSLPNSLGGQIQYAKFGLAGCAHEPNWRSKWQLAIDRLPRGVTPVAVAYADFQQADAPAPWQILAEGKARGCGAFLIDTYLKAAGSLLDHVTVSDLQELIRSAQGQGMLCVLAGSLGFEQIARVLPVAPDIVAVRGAACAGRRTGRLDAARVAELAQLVHSGPSDVVAHADAPAVHPQELRNIHFSEVRDKNA